jgi:hypothetical protein
MSVNSSTTSSRARGWFLGSFCITLAVLVTCAFAVRFTVLAPIAPRFTGNASLDQKLKFIRDNYPAGSTVGLVAGSSMAVNNVDADVLEDAQKQRFLNAGIWQASIRQTGHMIRLLAERYEIRELVLPVQFFELADDKRTRMDISDERFYDYLSRDIALTLTEPSDILDAAATAHAWRTTYGNPHSYEYLGFNRTGSVPLHVTQADIDPDHKLPPQDFPSTCHDCTRPLLDICVMAARKKWPVFLIMPPLTHHVRSKRPDVNAFYENRRLLLAQVAGQCHARLFDVARYGDFEDTCFADFAHFNATGDRIAAQMFVQWKRNKLPAPAAAPPIRCG